METAGPFKPYLVNEDNPGSENTRKCLREWSPPMEIGGLRPFRACRPLFLNSICYYQSSDLSGPKEVYKKKTRVSSCPIWRPSRPGKEQERTRAKTVAGSCFSSFSLENLLFSRSGFKAKANCYRKICVYYWPLIEKDLMVLKSIRFYYNYKAQ